MIRAQLMIQRSFLWANLLKILINSLTRLLPSESSIEWTTFHCNMVKEKGQQQLKLFRLRQTSYHLMRREPVGEETDKESKQIAQKWQSLLSTFHSLEQALIIMEPPLIKMGKQNIMLWEEKCPFLTANREYWILVLEKQEIQCSKDHQLTKRFQHQAIWVSLTHLSDLKIWEVWKVIQQYLELKRMCQRIKTW